MALPDSIQRTIAEHGLFSPADTVLVAVSGGPDSISLLHALHALGYNVQAAHLNHGIRGKEADEDANYVQEFCVKRNIPVHIGWRNVPALKKEQKLSTQQAARQGRYEFLTEAAGDVGAQAIATAHSRDDRTETVLLNILRGTGIEGLRGIPYQRGPFVRPLLDTSREEVEAYCALHELAPRRDSSNLSSAYARNNVRSELMPYLERRYNPSIRSALLRLSEIAASESDYLSQLAREWLQDRAEIPAGDLLALPVALQRRALREWLRSRRPEELADIGQETIEAIRGGAHAPFAVTLPGGSLLVRGDGTRLEITSISHREPAPAIEIAITPPAAVRFFEWHVEIEGDFSEIDTETLRVRNWREGDRIKLPAGTRKLQDIFTDAKVPRAERHTWPIVADKDGPVIVANLCASPRARGLTVRAAKAERTSPEEDR